MKNIAKTGAPPGRYNHADAVVEVERVRSELNLSQKEVSEGIAISESEYSQKKRGVINSFSIAEFGRIADFYMRRTGRPFIGFPFLGEVLQDIADRKAGGWTGPVEPQPPRDDTQGDGAKGNIRLLKRRSRP